MKLTEGKKEFIKENYTDKVNEVINARIDTDFTYYDDIANLVDRFSNIVACLRGEYTMDDLYSDLYDDYYNNNFDDVAIEIYEEHLDEEQRKEIDEA